ncbi:large conductance mechanosensitive channel protein MscL [Phycicoccus endophyticus]|uniref:Large conductance mechanosensitive channel protein MscL n=1 Tax=Phycicoccus endophyticus TaxID=1690220 RepID=A0A7G9R2A7_9MICO|nr:large conductance mechanosensitive channel protein MscL [Phycicoccus endophyticus]NHI19599.1 large conductance mechanosensitive channel protein MscL [Phycicoccus endophyticus]QNN49732.1 large conductance mechanosensitive channel protein MscL [Phycicoccus endophyticus]GGL34580.1 large-conductance mechanosensitive channel [Phycicoccus endophyticus]
MKGFKDFVMRGNLIELAVAFVIGAAFATVVEAFTTMFMDVLGKLGGTPDFSNWAPGGVHVGVFITALISFLIIAFVVYFFVVKPYTAAYERFFPKEPEAETVDPNTELLKEIRDELRAGRGV